MNAGGNRLIITFTKGHLSKLKKKNSCKSKSKAFCFLYFVLPSCFRGNKHFAHFEMKQCSGKIIFEIPRVI